MEIQVGEYVRTKYGIAKYIDVEIKSLGIIVIDKDIAHDHTDDYKNVITPEEILKHSFNIIDLIEKGDFINRLEIEKIIEPTQYTNYKKTLYCSESEGLYKGVFFNNDIKSVVTHEQMEAMEYEVK